MCKDLNGWLGLGSTYATGHTELSANVIRAGCCGVSRKRSLGEVPALLGLVLVESGGIEIGLGDGDIEDSGASRDCHGDGHVDACLGSC